MSATCSGVTPSLPSDNPNASRTNERLVQLTQTDKWTTRTAGHDDNLAPELAQQSTLAPISTPTAQPDVQIAPIGTADLTLQEAIPDLSLNTVDIASLKEWAADKPRETATSPSKSQQPTRPGQGSTLGSINQSRSKKLQSTPLSIYKQMNQRIEKTERRQAEQRQRRKTNQSVSESEANSSGEAEDEDIPCISSSSSKSKSDDEEEIL